MPTPHFSTCQGGVRSNPHNEGEMQHHLPSRLPAAPRTVKAPHGCTLSPQRLLAGPRCIPWAMFNSELQHQEGQCRDLSFPRGKLSHERLNNFSQALCCRAELETRQQVPKDQLTLSLNISTEKTTQEDAHPGGVPNSWR